MAVRLAPILAALCLASCSDYAAHRARTATLGMTEAQMESCAGIPGKSDVARVGGVKIVQYSFKQSTDALKVNTLMGGLSLGDTGTCTAIWTLDASGHVVKLRYTDATAGWGPAWSSCGPLVRDCLGEWG